MPPASAKLIRAVTFNGDRQVKNLLAEGLNPNTRDENGNPILLVALREDAFRVATVLVADPHIDINATNTYDETALMLASLKGQFALVKDMVLIRHAHVNRTDWTPLHYAATTGQQDISRFLIAQGAAVDAKSPNGTTPLMMAVRSGHIHLVKLLLDAGADVFLKNEANLVAADFAELYHQKEIMNGLRSRMRKLKELD
ncbi:MAG: ankyrin repeat domain-containing protein [Ottowia sp.]|nr:ankyrin repeat domain-containing protein [Ottowia sp.]